MQSAQVYTSWSWVLRDQALVHTSSLTSAGVTHLEVRGGGFFTHLTVSLTSCQCPLLSSLAILTQQHISNNNQHYLYQGPAATPAQAH